MANNYMEVVHALVAASNAFHRELDSRGYVVYYGGDGTGAVYKAPKGPTDWPVALLRRIEWEVKK